MFLYLILFSIKKKELITVIVTTKNGFSIIKKSKSNFIKINFKYDRLRMY